MGCPSLKPTPPFPSGKGRGPLFGPHINIDCSAYKHVGTHRLDGIFMAKGDIIKKGASHAIHIDRNMFLMMLKRMTILSSDDYKGVVFNFTEGKLLIKTTNPDIGESKEEMNIDFKGDPIEVAFNPRYFIDTLSVMDSKKVIINIIDEEKPCLFEEENNDTYISVNMPMRI